jgi:hypothetical protein
MVRILYDSTPIESSDDSRRKIDKFFQERVLPLHYGDKIQGNEKNPSLAVTLFMFLDFLIPFLLGLERRLHDVSLGREVDHAAKGSNPLSFR